MSLEKFRPVLNKDSKERFTAMNLTIDDKAMAKSASKSRMQKKKMSITSYGNKRGSSNWKVSSSLINPNGMSHFSFI